MTRLILKQNIEETLIADIQMVPEQLYFRFHLCPVPVHVYASTK